MLKISVCILFLLLSSCSYKKPHSSGQRPFSVKPDRVLFFKNVRQIYYENEEQKATGLILYRHHQRCKDPKKTCLSLAIVHNWRYEEAYLLIELNDQMVRNLQLNFKTKDTKDSVKIEQIKKEEYLAIAQKIKVLILQNAEIGIVDSEKTAPALTTEKEKDIYLTILQDYLDLVQ